jgi:hypothetical protein
MKIHVAYENVNEKAQMTFQTFVVVSPEHRSGEMQTQKSASYVFRHSFTQTTI